MVNDSGDDRSILRSISKSPISSTAYFIIHKSPYSPVFWLTSAAFLVIFLLQRRNDEIYKRNVYKIWLIL
mgnify:CR=1 FL=1